MRDFDFRLAGTSAFVLEAQGTRFFYKTGAEASGKIGVIVSAERGGLQLLLLPGEGVRLPAAAGRWMLTKADPTAADITGRLIVGDADFTASRVQGDVNLLNASALAASPGVKAITDQMLNNPTPKVRRYRYGMAVYHNTTADGTTDLGAFRLHNSSTSRAAVIKRILLSRAGGTPPASPPSVSFAMAAHLVGGGLSGQTVESHGLSEGNQSVPFASHVTFTSRIRAPFAEVPVGGPQFLTRTALATGAQTSVEAIHQPILLPPTNSWAITIGVPGMAVGESATALFEWEEWLTWPTE